MFAADAKFCAEQFGKALGAGCAAVGNAEDNLVRQLHSSCVGAVFEENQFVAATDNSDFRDAA